MPVGKCPHCGKLLGEDDIADYAFRGWRNVHYAYVCKRCGCIIGFSSMAHY